MVVRMAAMTMVVMTVIVMVMIMNIAVMVMRGLPTLSEITVQK